MYIMSRSYLASIRRSKSASKTDSNYNKVNPVSKLFVTISDREVDNELDGASPEIHHTYTVKNPTNKEYTEMFNICKKNGWRIEKDGTNYIVRIPIEKDKTESHETDTRETEAYETEINNFIDIFKTKNNGYFFQSKIPVNKIFKKIQTNKGKRYHTLTVTNPKENVYKKMVKFCERYRWILEEKENNEYVVRIPIYSDEKDIKKIKNKMNELIKIIREEKLTTVRYEEPVIPDFTLTVRNITYEQLDDMHTICLLYNWTIEEQPRKEGIEYIIKIPVNTRKNDKKYDDTIYKLIGLFQRDQYDLKIDPIKSINVNKDNPYSIRNKIEPANKYHISSPNKTKSKGNFFNRIRNAVKNITFKNKKPKKTDSLRLLDIYKESISEVK